MSKQLLKMRWMDYKYLMPLLLWLCLSLPKETLAQPGCGHFYVTLADADIGQFENTQVKASYKIKGKLLSKKSTVYKIDKKNRHYYLYHMDGLQKIKLKYQGKKMLLTLVQINCEENYLIDHVQFQPGHFKIDLQSKQLQKTKENTSQYETCANCYRIPFDEFNKEL